MSGYAVLVNERGRRPFVYGGFDTGGQAADFIRDKNWRQGTETAILDNLGLEEGER